MKNSLLCLLKIKTLISLTTTFVFTYLAIKGAIPVETITMIIGMVFTYYFNNKDGENNGIS